MRNFLTFIFAGTDNLPKFPGSPKLLHFISVCAQVSSTLNMKVAKNSKGRATHYVILIFVAVFLSKYVFHVHGSTDKSQSAESNIHNLHSAVFWYKSDSANEIWAHRGKNSVIKRAEAFLFLHQNSLRQAPSRGKQICGKWNFYKFLFSKYSLQC